MLRLTGRTQRRGASVHHYQLADRERVASVLWGMRARLLVRDFERESGRGDATVTLDAEALTELHALTGSYQGDPGLGRLFRVSGALDVDPNVVLGRMGFPPLITEQGAKHDGPLATG